MIPPDTIYAVSSGAGRAGVAVLRASGPMAGDALRSLCGRLPEARRASLRSIRSLASGELIDRGLVLWFPGPRSFTGEDMMELHVHGGRAVVAAAIDALSNVPGLRPAEAGEFTRRAFLAGRLDLVEAEGLAALIDADTAAQRRVAAFHLSGGASRTFEAWRTEIVGILARLEAAIDFSDEDGVEGEAMAGLMRRLSALRQSMQRELGRKSAERLREGFRVVLAGPVNAGKSSLFNRLVGREAAIVSRLPGTTRDSIEAHLDLDGWPVTLCDTAGLREGQGDEVEAEGMSRTRERMRSADLVLWVMAPDVGAESPPDSMDSEALWIGNKSDLGGGVGQALQVSAKDGSGLDRLAEEIALRARSSMDHGEPPLLTRDRHRRAVRDCCQAIEEAISASEGPLELVAENVRLAARPLARLVGRVDPEDVLEEVFSSFCIGK